MDNLFIKDIKKRIDTREALETIAVSTGVPVKNLQLVFGSYIQKVMIKKAKKVEAF